MGVEEMIWKHFASSFLWKYKNPLTHCRNSKYDAYQYGLRWTPESSGVIKVEIPKLSVGKRGTDWGGDGRRGILQCLPPTDALGRKAWRSERPGSREQNQTQGFIPRPKRY